MATLYVISQSNNGRVASTCNLSEDWVGYATRYGDGAGDFSPCSRLTVSEVKELGRALVLPENLINKTPIDGLFGKSDEENLGFTYAALDRYIRTGYCDDASLNFLRGRPRCKILADPFLGYFKLFFLIGFFLLHIFASRIAPPQAAGQFPAYLFFSTALSTKSSSSEMRLVRRIYLRICS